MGSATGGESSPSRLSRSTPRARPSCWSRATSLEADEDEEAIGRLLDAVGAIYRSADHLEGDPRYDDIAAKLAALDR